MWREPLVWLAFGIALIAIAIGLSPPFESSGDDWDAAPWRLVVPF